MKLELKHLAPYLPYLLRCKNANTTFEMTGSFLDEWYNYGELPKDLKPILRPLDDLEQSKILQSFEGYGFSYLRKYDHGYAFHKEGMPLSHLKL